MAGDLFMTNYHHRTDLGTDNKFHDMVAIRSLYTGTSLYDNDRLLLNNEVVG